MKLQVLLYHTHTHQTMLNPNFNYTFLKSVFGNKGTPINFIPVHPSTYTLYITRKPISCSRASESPFFI